MKLSCAAAALSFAALLSGAGEASASILTYTYDAKFSTGPLTDITGTVTIDYASSTSWFVTDFTTSLSSSYTTISFQTFGTTFLICNNHPRSGGCQLSVGSNQFYFNFDAPEGVLPDSARFAYSASGESSIYHTTAVIFGTSAVPLPSSAPMLGAGLVVLGAFGYGANRRKAAVAA